MNVAQALSAAGLPLAEARTLLASACMCSRESLIAHTEREVPATRLAVFEAYATQRRHGIPMAYVLGEREFYGLMLTVNPCVLIPRHETELLVEIALELAPAQASVLDLGTGSGAVAVALAHTRRDLSLTGVDIAEDALAVARKNADYLKLPIQWRLGRWYEPVSDVRFHVIASNPPYIAEFDPHLVQGDVRYEPRSALIGGADGLVALREIIFGAPKALHPGGWLALEHGYDQAPAVTAMLNATGFSQVQSRCDLAGIARCTYGQYDPE